MDHFERKLIYPFIKTFSLILQVYRQYFFIRAGSKTDLGKFLNKLINTHELNLNMKYQKKDSHFWISRYTLKTTDYITKIFRNKEDHQTILNINSGHPKLLKNSIPYSQTLRIKRVCSAKKDLTIMQDK